MASARIIPLGGVDLRVHGRLLRTAQLNDEFYVSPGDPSEFMARMKHQRVGADVFTFVQELHDREVHHAQHPHRVSWDEMAVMPVSTYAHWFDKQIKFKPRNKLRKAWKSGVETRVLSLDDTLVRGIMDIYNETPLRQGKRNWHYGKDFDTVKREHATFLDRSEFIGAFFMNELIGFAKVTHSPNYSILMNIVAKVSQRDKAPMNALVAKTVEQVAARNIPLLNYGVWGRRGLNDFKVANAFECMAVPRYHVPLTRRGELALKLELHRSLKERMPEAWIIKLADTRARWNEWRVAKLAALHVGRPAAPKAAAAADADS
jgi:hypothetical protein